MPPIYWYLFWVGLAIVVVRGAPYPLRMAAGGLRRPSRRRRVGCDYSGTIEAVGRSVTGFTVGEPVFGMGDGTLAQYLAVRS